MSAALENNAIARRLGTMRRYWKNFTSADESRYCVWSIQDNEVDMIEAFYEMESSEAGETPDLFIKFVSPYKGNHIEYTRSLLNELQIHADDSKAIFENVGVELGDWRALPPYGGSIQLPYFVSQLQAFYEKLDIKGNLVAYLAPTQISNNGLWVEWLEKNLRFMAEGINIMLVQFDQNPGYNGLVSTFPKKVHKLNTDLNMADAFSEMAAQGKQSDPGVKFRRLYIAILQAAEKSKLNEAQELAAEAFKICRKHDWKLLEATIHMVLGGVLVGHKKIKKGLYTYDTAIGLCQLALDEGDEQAPHQIVVAILAKAMTFFIQKKYDLAAKTYEEAAVYAHRAGNTYLAMDSYRMASECYKKQGHKDDAVNALKKCRLEGQKLEEQVRQDTTYPVAMKELFELSPPADQIDINKEMTELLGENWQEVIEEKLASASAQPT